MIERRKWTWTEFRAKQGAQVFQIVKALQDYWPLTLRQIYYRLVAAGHIENTRSRYNDLSKLIKHMRLGDFLPWEVMEDRTRRLSDKRGFTDHGEFIAQETDNFLEGYTRCLVQDQVRYVEIWCEKDALSQVFEKVAWPYCIRAVTCKGYQSVTFLDNYRRRALAAQEREQVPVILYFGDLDPSGVQMFEATRQTLEEEMNLFDVEYIRVALTPEQVAAYELPSDPAAVKLSDRRLKAYVRRFGMVAVELDALHPQTLQEMAVEAIESQFDMDLFMEHREVERQERERLAAIKAKVMAEFNGMTSQT
ncbi:MAG: hypothetical protein D4R73_11140 [Deltaproteobacteria bacterium]|nr:MAG: hypothetical protein D4R73_11140 [Deltaproteobacteria bacterium]